MDIKFGASKTFQKAFASLMIGMCGTVGQVHGQTQYRPPVTLSESAPPSTNLVLQEMTRAAGVIFAGQVISVHRPADFSSSGEVTANGVVEVVFRVDQALRGSTSGSVYTLREWAGLWAGSSQRYRPGLRLLMFLRSPNASGLTSTVHGSEGAVPLRGSGAAPGPDDTNPKAADWLVDLRWVQAQAPRQDVSPLKPIRWPVRPVTPNTLETGAETNTEDRSELSIRDPIPPWTVATRPSDSPMPPLSQVLDLCRSWMRQSDAAR